MKTSLSLQAATGEELGSVFRGKNVLMIGKHQIISFLNAKALLLDAFGARREGKEMKKERSECIDLIVLPVTWGSGNDKEAELRARGEPIMESQEFRYLVLEYYLYG